MANTIEIKIPDIGGHDNVPVIEVLVKAGDTVAKEQSLITLESDKATMEIPSTAAGVIRELRLKVGDEVSEGAVIAILEVVGAADPTSPSPLRGEGRDEGTRSPDISDSANKGGEPPASTRPSPQPSPPGGEGAKVPQAAASSKGRRTLSASWSSWVPGRVAIRRRSVPPIWASTRSWSSVTRASAASASTWAAFRPRRCCMPPR